MPNQSTIRAYVQLTRPENAAGSVITYCIGYFLLPGVVLRVGFFVGLFIILALHSLATVQNDMADFEIDRANNRHSPLQDHRISLQQARVFVKLLALASLVAAVLSPQRGIHLLAVAVLLLLAWLYNLPPVRASRRPILSMVVLGLCFGAAPLLYGYVLDYGKISSYILILAFFWILIRVSTAIMKDYKDVKGDKIFNKNTFYVRYGAKTTARVSIWLALVSYIGVLVALLTKTEGRHAIFVFMLLVAGLLAIRNIVLRLQLTKTKSDKQLNTIFHKSVFAHNQFEIVVFLCLILS